MALSEFAIDVCADCGRVAGHARGCPSAAAPITRADLLDPVRDILLSVEAECERIRLKGLDASGLSLGDMLLEARGLTSEATIIRFAALCVTWVVQRRARA